MKVSLLPCIALVISNMIGVGVFTSLGFQLSSTNSPFVIIILWAFGGLLAMGGALSYTQLSEAYPRSGGEYNFLSRSYHPAVGFMAGILSALVGFSAPIALSAMAFAKYTQIIIGEFSEPIVATCAILLITLAHLRSLRIGSCFQTLISLSVVTLSVLFIVRGFGLEHSYVKSFVPHAHDIWQIFSRPFAVSLMYVMYAYSGWNASTYIMDEVKDQTTVIRSSLLLGTVITSSLYLGLNAAFLHAAPISEMVGQLDVAKIAAYHIFEKKGALVVSTIICIALLGSMSAMTWIG